MLGCHNSYTAAELALTGVNRAGVPAESFRAKLFSCEQFKHLSSKF